MRRYRIVLPKKGIVGLLGKIARAAGAAAATCCGGGPGGAAAAAAAAASAFFCAFLYCFSRLRRSLSIFSKPFSSSFRFSPLDIAPPLQFFTASVIMAMYWTSNTMIFCSESCSTATSSIGSAKDACAERT